MAASFDEIYARSPACFGAAPSLLLRAFLEKYEIRGPGRALDAGCGEGRNALYLARRGFRVDAFDTSGEAIGVAKSLAEAGGLPVHAWEERAQDWSSEPESYDFILAFTLLDHLREEDIPPVADKFVRALAPGGHFFGAVFTREDPARRESGAPESPTARFVKHYFEPGELRRLFAPLELLEYSESYELDRTHGPTHYHGMARLLGRKA